MHKICLEQGNPPPKFEELDLFFRVTLYPKAVAQLTTQPLWYTPLLDHLQKEGKISVQAAEKIWKVTRKTANQSLKQLCKEGILAEISQGPFDPHKVFVLTKKRL